MDANFQPAQDQIVMPQTTAPVQKSGNSLLMVVCALLLLSLLANAYFFSQMNSKSQVDQPKGQQIPVVKTEVQPTVATTIMPTGVSTVSAQVDVIKNWKTLKTTYFEVKHPSDVKETFWEGEIFTLQKTGPSQNDNTEFYDGIKISFIVRELSRSAEEYAKDNVKGIRNEGNFEIVQDVIPIKIGENNGFSYVISGLGIHKYYIFPVDAKNGMLLEVADSSIDPSGLGFKEQSLKILETLKIIN